MKRTLFTTEDLQVGAAMLKAGIIPPKDFSLDITPYLKPLKVRALGWRNPYAALMLHGKIETRNRPTNVRGPVLIYATKKPYEDWAVMYISDDVQYRRIDSLPLSLKDQRANGKAIAIGWLTDCRPMTKEDEDACFVKYRKGLWCWIFENVQPIEHFDFKGSQGWSILTPETIEKIKIVPHHAGR